MAAIAITAASVLASAAATLRREYNFGYASATAGQSVYLDANNVWQKMISSAAAGNNPSDLKGITLNGGGIGQPAVVCVEDPNFTPGGTLTNGLAVYNFTTAGAITVADIPTTLAYPVVLGIAKSATVMNLKPVASGAVI